MVIWYVNNKFKIVVFKISNERNNIHTGFRGFVIIQSQNLPKGNFYIPIESYLNVNQLYALIIFTEDGVL